MDGPQSDKPLLDLDDLVASRNSQYAGARKKIDRFFEMIKTYPPGQVVRRLSKVAKKRFGIRYQPDNNISDVQVRGNVAFATLASWSETQLPIHRIENGNLTLLNQKYQVGESIDWRTEIEPRPSHLWRFQFHYHEWLLSYGFGSDFVWQTIDHWIENNRVDDARTHDDAWHPYCISRRLPVWQKLVAARQERISDSVALSIFNQADFLSRNLETDLRGNHLLENLHALAMSACFFEGDKPANWERQCVEHLESELKMQVLTSGEHYERSPMYQCVVCANLLQLVIVSRSVSEKLCELATGYASRMLKFLETILCPDGEIPLLSDSCFGEAPSVESLQVLAKIAGVEFGPVEPVDRANTVGDYWVHRSTRNDFLLFDAGQVAADGLPGHAHCDLLNIVGSVQGQRVLVDSGNSSYDLDSTRSYCRSSVAHNVLTVDEIDHADVWSKFRMGFRGQPGNFRTGSIEDFNWAIAEHNAYRRRGIKSIKRIVLAHQSDLLWICLDSVGGVSSSHELEGFLHFAESAKLSHCGKQVSVEMAKVTVNVSFFGADSVEMAKSWHCCEFGKKNRNYTAVYRSKSPEFRMLGWFLCPATDGKTTSLELGSSPSSVLVTHKNRLYEFDLKKL